MSPASIGKYGSGLYALLAASATALVFDLALTWTRGFQPPFAYVAVCAALSLVAAAAIGAAATGLGHGAGLAAWAALTGFLVLPGAWLPSLALAAGFGLATVWWARSRTGVATPIADGAVVGWALAASLLVWPVVASSLGGRLAPGFARRLEHVAAFAGLLFAAWLYERHRSRRWPGAAAVCLALGVGLVALNWARSTRPPRPPGAPTVSEAAGVPAVSGARPDRPTVLVLLLDTVRVDHLSLYGHERRTDPRLAEFVSTGARPYPLAFSPSPWTLPAHASLFTGQLPSEHGAHSLSWRVRASGGRPAEQPVLRATTTLAERLRAVGYRTAAVFANPVLESYPGLERGFDLFRRPPPEGRRLRLVGEALRGRWLPAVAAHAVRRTPSARVVNREVLRALDGCEGSPCFVFANYMDAHDPLAPPPATAGVFGSGGRGPAPLYARMDRGDEVLRRAAVRYDEMLLDLDAALGELLGELRQRGILDSSWVVITSDHGEAFGEHGVVRHGTGLHNEQTRIPLLIRPPRGEALPRTAGAVSLLDVTATLSAVATGETLGRGRDLRLGEAGRPVELELFGYFRAAALGPPDLEVLGARADTPGRGVVVGSRKLIESEDRAELYDLVADPDELRDLAAADPEGVEALRRLLPAAGGPQ